MPLAPYTGVWTQTQLLHLLRRTLVSVRKSDLTHFSGQTMQQVVSELLAVPPALPSPPVNHYQSYFPNNPDPTAALGETWVNNSNDGQYYQYQRIESLRGWWLGLLMEQNPSILEKMTLFWFNHIPIEMGRVISNPFHCYRYNSLLRSYALGNLKNMVRDVTIHPAMMSYLNNEDNTRNAPNENYARELQELFTIGKDLPNHFTEDDVKAAARVLTGWRIAWPNVLDIYFLPSVHDPSDKVFSSFYNNTVITGRSNDNAGTDELNDLLTMIFNHNEVAKYIVRKLYRFFVYPKIDATVESTVITPLADTFRSNNYEILPVLQELLTSQHFFDVSKMACLIKSPLELAAGVGRIFNIQPNAAGVNAVYHRNLLLTKIARIMGMEIGTPSNVAGWEAYRLAPVYHQFWITSETLRPWENFIDSITADGYEYVVKIDALAFTATLDNPADPNALINEVLTLIHPIASQTSVVSALKNILLSNQVSDYYWTSAWNAYVSNPSDAVNTNIVKSRLQLFYRTVLKMVEFNLF